MFNQSVPDLFSTSRLQKIRFLWIASALGSFIYTLFFLPDIPASLSLPFFTLTSIPLLAGCMILGFIWITDPKGPEPLVSPLMIGFGQTFLLLVLLGMTAFSTTKIDFWLEFGTANWITICWLCLPVIVSGQYWNLIGSQGSSENTNHSDFEYGVYLWFLYTSLWFLLPCLI